MLETLFCIYCYLITGYIIHTMLSVWENRSVQKQKTQAYEVPLWSVAFIEYIIKSWKKLNKTSKEN